MARRGEAALAGVVAAVVALGIGELVAGTSKRAPSLLGAVGDVVVDKAPRFVVDFGIDVFGTSDKQALVAGTLVLSVVFGAALGVLAARRLAVGVAGYVAFGVVGLLAALRDPQSAAVPVVVTVVVAVGAGVGALVALVRLLRPGAEPRSADQAAPIRLAGDRRTFLAVAGAVAIFGVAAGAAGRALSRAAVAAARAGVTLPRADRPAPSPPASAMVDVAGVSPLITPNGDFYRIDTALFGAPAVDLDSWRLRVKGMVDRPFELSWDELVSMPLVEEHVTLSCVSNEVGGGLVGTAAWLGVPLADLLDRAGVDPRADQIVGRSVDGFTAGFPVAAVADGRRALVAVGMNGEALPLRHGFPARLVVAGLYGYVSATKWLEEVELTRFDEFEGYWVPRGWSQQAPVKTQSRIDTPHSGVDLAAGRVAVAGVAWAPTRGLDRVEVQVDDEPWRDARLADALNDSTWRQWVLRWDATPGDHTIRVRATDGTGETQTEERSRPDPDGATGWHTIRVSVT